MIRWQEVRGRGDCLLGLKGQEFASMYIDKIAVLTRSLTGNVIGRRSLSAKSLMIRGRKYL